METKLEDVSVIKKRIRNDLPEEAFRRVPAKALLFIPLCGFVLASIWFVANYELPWWAMVLISMILGQVYATSAFLAHEVSHGSVVKSRKTADFLVYFGLYPFLISPHLWRIWHVCAHHGNTNEPRDPDAIVTLDEYNNTVLSQFWTKFIPCSKHKVAGVLFFAYWFTLHAQNILWFNKQYKHWDFDNYGFNKTKAILDTLLYLMFWGASWYYVGGFNGFFVVLFPMMMANAILLSFIATEHTCLPRFNSDNNHPLLNSVSAKVPAFVDKFNLNFSNHVEHHLFPAMNYKYTPLVRQWLRENMAEHYLEPKLSKCFKVLFTTPRVYLDENTLCYPSEPDKTKVSMQDVRDMLIR